MSLDVVVVGNLLVDDVVLPDGTTRMGQPGGATLYAALGALVWGARVGVVSLRGDDYPGWALEAAAARGVDVSGIAALDRCGLRTWLLYEGHRRRRVVHRLDCPSHAEASPGPERIPSSFRCARAFHLAPMPLEVQRSLVDTVSAIPGALVSLDPHVPIGPATAEMWHGVLAGVDVLFVGEDEIEEPRVDLRALSRALAGGRLRRVLFKRGPRGGLAYDAREDRFVEWEAKGDRVTDPTGAGDAFAGGFLAGSLNGDALEPALRRALVSASFAIEEWGPAGLIGATPETAEHRLRSWLGA